MGGQDDLVASLEAIMAIRREELREPPSPEEILAYRDGRLEGEARRAFEARLAAHPDAARALADLAAFPDVRPAPGAPVASEGDVERGWRAFRALVEEDEEAPAAPQTPPTTHVRRPSRFPLAAAGLALVVAGVAGFLAGRGFPGAAGRPAANVTIAELTPREEGLVRSPAPLEVVLDEDSEALVLVLPLPEPPEEGTFSDYRIEVVGDEGAVVTSRRGLRPTSLGTFHLSFSRGALAPGVYQIQLQGIVDRGSTSLATYTLRLREPPGEP